MIFATLDRPKIKKSKGLKWDELQKFQQVEILQQIPGLQADKQIKNYMFYYSTQYKWIITNAFDVPISTAKSYFRG